MYRMTKESRSVSGLTFYRDATETFNIEYASDVVILLISAHYTLYKVEVCGKLEEEEEISKGLEGCHCNINI